MCAGILISFGPLCSVPAAPGGEALLCARQLLFFVQPSDTFYVIILVVKYNDRNTDNHVENLNKNENEILTKSIT